MKISVIGFNNSVEEHLLVNYFNLLYSWSENKIDEYYINRIIHEFRHNGYFNFYFIMRIKKVIYDLQINGDVDDNILNIIHNLSYSLKGIYNDYSYKILSAYMLFLNGNNKQAYEIINSLDSLEFFDITLFKNLLAHVIGIKVNKKILNKIKQYYSDDKTNHPQIIMNVISQINN